MTALPDQLLSDIPPPEEVHRRLGEAVRAEKILRRLLRLSLAAREERARALDNLRLQGVVHG